MVKKFHLFIFFWGLGSLSSVFILQRMDHETQPILDLGRPSLAHMEDIGENKSTRNLKCVYFFKKILKYTYNFASI